ncbi:LamG domain-containing protein [bacterium]|nr:LamG domain-containing protein [bacterium]
MNNYQKGGLKVFFCGLLYVCLVCGPIFAEKIEESFDQIPTGPALEIPSWKANQMGEDACASIEEFRNSSDKSIRLKDTSKQYAAGITRKLDQPIRDKFYLEYQIYPIGKASGNYLYCHLMEDKEQALGIMFYNGFVCVTGKGEQRQVKIGKFDANKWYTVKLNGDITNSNYSLWVVDEKENTVASIENAEFINTIDFIATIRFATISTFQGDFYIDNIRLVPNYQMPSLVKAKKKTEVPLIESSPVNTENLVQVKTAKGEKGLIAHYTFNEGRGTVLKDVSGNGNSGKIYGAAYVNSPRGYALRFDGADDCVDLGSPPSLNLNGELTIEAWIKTDIRNKKQSHHWLIFGDSLEGFVIHRNYNLRISNNNLLYFEWGNGDAWQCFKDTESVDFDGTWKHVAVVIESPNKYYLYVDGKLIEHRQIDFLITKTSGGPFQIGGWGHGYFKGDIDEILLYNKALSTQEILKHAGKEDLAVQPKCKLETGFSYHKNAFFAEMFCENIEKDADIQIKVINCDDKKVVANKKVILTRETRPGSKRWLITDLVEASQLKPGDYRFEVNFFDRAKNCILTVFEKVPYIEKPSWFNNKIGITDKVMPPYTPLEVEKREDEYDIHPWGRQYTIGASPFLDNIKSAQADLLTGPVRLTGKVNGEEITLRSNMLELLSSKPNKAIFARNLIGRGMNININTDIEYDGFTKIDWEIEAIDDVNIDELILEFPIQKNHAKYFYAWPGVSKVYDVSFYSGSLNDNFAFSFKPIIWIGDEERGLSWFAESDKNWFLKDEQKAIQILKSDKEVLLRITLIDKPIHLEKKKKLTYVFALQATPVRPMERSAWDDRIVRQPPYANEYAWINKKIQGEPALKFYSDKGAKALLVWRWWDAFSYVLPLGHENKFPKLVNECHKYNLKVVPYAVGFLLSEVAPEFNNFKYDMLIRPTRPFYISTLPGLQKQMTYYACRQSAWQDFVVYSVSRLIDKYDVDGIYLDGTILPIKCNNALHGCGYRKPDGTYKSTYPIFATRQLMKRLYTIVKERKPDGIVDAHSGNCMNSSAIAFSTTYWEGEQLRPKENFLDSIPLDTFRTQFMGHNLGVPADFLYYCLKNYNASLAVTLLHDVPVRPEKEKDLEILSGIWKIRDAFGCNKAKFLPYWKNQDFVKVTPSSCYASLYQHPNNGVLVIVSNLTQTKSKVELVFDLHKLGLTKAVVAANDSLSSDNISINKNKIVLDIPSYEWKIFWIREK